MLKLFKTVSLSILTLFLFNSCDDYCEFQFSEDFFPLKVGNTWVYSNYRSSGSFERWKIVDKVNESDIEKYKLERSDRNGKVLGDGFFYYSGKKLYSTLPFYMEWIGSDYILADFSLNEGDIYNLDFEDYRVIVISKKQNSITFGYMPNDTWLDFPDLQITFDKGIGITEYYYFESQGKQILADYLIN